VKKLTEKREKFVLAYFDHGNGSKAYRDNFSASRMRPKTINNKAYELLQRGDIRGRLDELRLKAESEAVLTKQQALEILSSIARVNISDIAEFEEQVVGEDEEGKPITATNWRIKNSNELPANAMVAIKSVTATKMGPKLELHDKPQVIKQLTEILGWNAPIKTDSNLNVRNDWHIHPTSAKTDE
jgi:phage terminase small subunit